MNRIYPAPRAEACSSDAVQCDLGKVVCVPFSVGHKIRDGVARSWIYSWIYLGIAEFSTVLKIHIFKANILRWYH